MKTSIGFVSLATGVLLSSAAAGQVVDPLPVSEPSNDRAASYVEAGGGATVALDFKFAPTWDADLIQSEGDRLSEFQTSSVSLTYRSEVRKSIVLTGSVAIKVDTDFDDDAVETPAALVGDLKLNWNRGFRRISPFVSYNLESRFKDHFSDHDATDQTVSLGADIQFLGRVRCKPGENPDDAGACSGTPVFKLAVIPSIDRTFSDKASNERWTPRLRLKADGGFDWGLGWEIIGTAEYRRYDIVSPTTGVDREWRFIASASLDIAKLIESDGRILKEFKLGVRWNGAERSGAADKSTASLLPVIRISIPIGS